MTERKLVTRKDRPTPPQPTRILRRQVDKIPIGMPKSEYTALDVGCGSGRNSVFMAARGLKVTGVDVNPDELRMAQILRDSTIAQAHRCKFVEADVRTMPEFEDEPFDLVTVNEVLHQLPKGDQYDLLRDVQRRTKRIGTNVVTGYLLSDEVKDAANRERMLNPGELQRFYEGQGWLMSVYLEGPSNVQQVNGRELVQTKVQMVAITPPNHRPLAD